jgi:hypothetical protein
MRMRLCSIVAALAAAGACGAVHADSARAGWCWPSCSAHAVLSPGTSTYNGCWYLGGEVCSGWNYWGVNGIDKQCYPRCDLYGYTQALVLYGFENGSTIRGRFTDYAGIFRIRPVDVSMGGYLRAQVNWWPYFDGRLSHSSLLQAASI